MARHRRPETLPEWLLLLLLGVLQAFFAALLGCTGRDRGRNRYSYTKRR